MLASLKQNGRSFLQGLEALQHLFVLELVIGVVGVELRSEPVILDYAFMAEPSGLRYPQFLKFQLFQDIHCLGHGSRP